MGKVTAFEKPLFLLDYLYVLLLSLQPNMHFDITIAGLKIFLNSLKLSRNILRQCDTVFV